jgi:hypothetical protein
MHLQICVRCLVCAGNNGVEVANTLPGLCPDAIAVTALNNADGPAYFSNRASSSSSASILNMLMAAPGVNINSTVPVVQGSYEIMSGTSMVSLQLCEQLGQVVLRVHYQGVPAVQQRCVPADGGHMLFVVDAMAQLRRLN